MQVTNGVAISCMYRTTIRVDDCSLQLLLIGCQDGQVFVLDEEECLLWHQFQLHSSGIVAIGSIKNEGTKATSAWQSSDGSKIIQVADANVMSSPYEVSHYCNTENLNALVHDSNTKQHHFTVDWTVKLRQTMNHSMLTQLLIT